MALRKLWVKDVAKDARIAEDAVEFSLERFNVPSLKPAQKVGMGTNPRFAYYYYSQ